MTAALALEDGIITDDPKVIAAIRDGMGRSRTHLSDEVLADAGIELSARRPYEAAVRRIEAMASDLEAILRD